MNGVSGVNAGQGLMDDSLEIVNDTGHTGDTGHTAAPARATAEKGRSGPVRNPRGKA